MDTDGLTDVELHLPVAPGGRGRHVEPGGHHRRETAATYTLTAADAGKKIKVQVSFTDELSGEEMRTSAAYPSSGTVTPPPTPPRPRCSASR